MVAYVIYSGTVRMSSAARVLSLLTIFVLALSSLGFLSGAGVARAATEPASPPAAYTGFTFVSQAPQDMPVLVSLGIPLRNVGLLNSLAKEVSDPSSPQFRHFITPQQAQEEFLPTAAFDSLLQYVQGSGLDVVLTGLDSIIVVQGTASQMRQAFGASVYLYTNGTSSYYVSQGPATFDGAYVYASNATFIYTRPALSGSSSNPSGVTFTEGGIPASDLPAVYNATTLYNAGFTGKGETVGILDFYGSPTITSDLQLFDQIFNFPNPTFTVTPIGPYAPNLGVSVGWSTEVSLDVELSHAMAPRASIQLYVANGALSLADALSVIVQDGSVTTLSQSFGTPEWWFSESYYFGGPSLLEFNVLMPDLYYALGSLEGITFTASSGDRGGSGSSAGPEGTPEYPATSPFVTSVGGTQTYVSATSGGGSTYAQTAWSNIGYVPNGVNVGGGGGGVSILEPKPWYQQSQTVPTSFPNGRLNPDLSLQAGGDPGTYVVDAGSVISTGGTSESTQLFGGLLALVAQDAGGSLGNINPFLYSVADNSATYAKAFTPITTGYIVPWVASSGYNLVTGWGAPNIGVLASLYLSTVSSPSLTIAVDAEDSAGNSLSELIPGQNFTVVAAIVRGFSIVTSGSFTASLVTLSGTSVLSTLSYNASSGFWQGYATEGGQSGSAYVSVSGTSGSLSGTGITTIFAGYLASFVAPFELPLPLPWSTLSPLNIEVTSTELNGSNMPTQDLQMAIEPYSIFSNTYTTAGTLTLKGNSTSGMNTASMTGTYPYGPIMLALGGSSYGYLPIVNGIYLQSSYIYPQVAAEPGSVAPGQSLFIQANPQAPANLAGLPSYETGLTLGDDVPVGSNVTASLVSPSGAVVSTASLALQACGEAVRICQSGATNINGYLPVPANAAPGLYTVILNATYDSYTAPDTLFGMSFSQVLVSSGASTPTISLSTSPLYEGQTVQVAANIAYPNGTEVKYGEYTVLIYPEELQNQFTFIMHSEYAGSQLTQLQYDPAQNRWVGEVTLPSPYDAASLSGVNDNSFYYSGPYEAYVTGVSFDGTPTTSQLSAQQPFFVDPYIFTAGSLSSVQQTTQLALNNTVITSSLAMSGDVFIQNNTIQGGNVTIANSHIIGTLYVVNARLTLVGVDGGNLVAQNSSVILLQSSIVSVQLTNSQILDNTSVIAQLSPALPTIQVQSPAGGISYNGTLGITATVGGQQISTVWFYLDGTPLASFNSSSSPYSYQLDTTMLADGVHTLEVVASQSDGLSASTFTQFATDNSLIAANNTIADLMSSLNTATSNEASLLSQISAADSSIGTLNQQLTTANNNTSTLTYEVYGIAAIAVLALIFAVVAFATRGGAKEPEKASTEEPKAGSGGEAKAESGPATGTTQQTQ